MAFRGRGRGRGGGGFFQYAKQEPFEFFPENVTLPSVSDIPQEQDLISRNIKLAKYLKDSAFYLEENAMKKMHNTEIEKFSDRSKPSKWKRDSLGQLLLLTSRNFPEELVGGFRGKLQSRQKVQWNPQSGLQRLDFLEKREDSLKDKVKKEGEESEDEDDEEEEEEESEDFSDDDYNQNEYFDDDEDDYNMEDDGADEPEY